MGDIADMMLDGTLDYETGEYIGKGGGYPRTLQSTMGDGYKKNNRPPVNVQIVRNYLGSVYKISLDIQQANLIQRYGQYKKLESVKLKRVCNLIRTDKVSWNEWKEWVAIALKIKP